MTAAATEYPQEALDELEAQMWRDGNLAWLLQPHQRPIYEHYRAWEANPPTHPDAEFDVITYWDFARRIGKTTLRVLIRLEDGQRHPGWIMTMATAFQKDIADIIIPILQMLTITAPEDCRPRYHGGQSGQTAGIYFPNGSVIKLVGVDKNPNGLRGRASDGFDFIEAAYIKNLEPTVRNVVLPQFQHRPWARMCMESSAPEDLDHDTEQVFIPDAKLRSAYLFRTIDENTSLSPRDKAKALRLAGGREHPTCRREYYGERLRDPQRTIVPEFDIAKHVQAWQTPEYAHCYVSADPGTRDLFGLLFGYWHFGMQALYIQREWTAGNALTLDVAQAIRTIEQELWGAHELAAPDPFAWPGTRSSTDDKAPDMQAVKAWHPHVGAPAGALTYFDGKLLRANPYARVSDIDLRLCRDLSEQYGLDIEPVRKLHSLEAMTSAFRDAVQRGNVIISPECPQLIDHLTYGRWNEKRTEWDRTPKFGHFDLLACAVYMWLRVSQGRNLNPNAPYRPTAEAGVRIQERLPWQKTEQSVQQQAMRALTGRDRNQHPGRIAMRTR